MEYEVYLATNVIGIMILMLIFLLGYLESGDQEMSGFETAVRGGLRFKRHSEALVADEKRRKKKKKAKPDKDDSGPVVVDLPPELADDPAAVAAAATLQEGKQQSNQDGKEVAQTKQTDAEAAAASPSASEKGETDKTSADPRSVSRESSQRQQSEDVEALLAETNPHWTQAERAFFLARKAREAERIKKQLQLTHRQRMEKFNQHLASLSEHFDQPRIGPG
ncbi:hypothetical protein Efla_000655 [Eimeria flavescens]